MTPDSPSFSPLCACIHRPRVRGERATGVLGLTPLAIVAAVLLALVHMWTVYNLPVLIAGVRSHLRARKDRSRLARGSVARVGRWPSFSVLVPAKNEELLLPRLLDALLQQDYPPEQVEIVVIDDGSTDGTTEVCRAYAQKSQGRITILRGAQSAGKPAALNRALTHVDRDIVAVFDADNVPELDCLRKAAACFADPSVTAVQGRTMAINPDVNMLTKFVALEEAVWYEAYIRGKDALQLFVHLKGSCQFIRRDALLQLGGWSAGHLSEDMEISARLTHRGHQIRYAPEVRAWQETPESVTQMFHQRVRWYRGSMEVALRYGRLISKLSLKRVDAEMTLLGPFVLILSLIGYALGPLLFPTLGQSTLLALTLAGWALMTATITVGAAALWHVARPKHRRDLLWLPFIYAYWTFQVVLASWALGEIVLGLPRRWRSTARTGTVSAHRPTDTAPVNA
jgi:cellulose synthase/poly-beta-1,6-N-acetylglucosamine synthase-like glycosyltransferase